MMPIKEILAMRPVEPGPPILVIDETTIKSTVDAGPVCGCHEKYDSVQRYIPFVAGGVHPYNRRKIKDSECFQVQWQKLRIGAQGYNFEKAVATHVCELPKNYKKPKEINKEKFLLVNLPQYTDAYLAERMRRCGREHLDCYCPV